MVLPLAYVCGCGGSTTSTESAPVAGATVGALADDAIEAMATTYARDGGFTKENRVSYPTRQHQGNPLVNVYANAIAHPTYASLDYGVAPDASIAFPPGSMLVKEMLGADGQPDVLTVMYKKTSGYDPSGGDWWYGRLGTDGVPTDPTYAGLVDFCVSCHAGAAASDHAFGVSSDNK